MSKTYTAQQLTRIGRVAGVTYYEHPTRGDEAPLVTLNEDGTISQTDFWEISDAIDAAGI